MAKKLIFFDFDGTIADSLEVAVAVLQEIAPMLKLPTPTRAQVMDWKTKGIVELMQLTGVSLLQIPKIVKLARQSFEKKTADVPIIEGMAALIHDFVNKGYEMHIISTNAAANIQFILDKYQINVFSAIHTPTALFGKDTVIRKVGKKLGFSPENIYMIGDEVRDIEAAQKAGVQSVGVTWGFNHKNLLVAANPHFLIEKVEDLAFI